VCIDDSIRFDSIAPKEPQADGIEENDESDDGDDDDDDDDDENMI
jgi:hypothetical protein